MKRTRLRPVAKSKQADRRKYAAEARAFIAAAREAKAHCPVMLAIEGRKLLPVDVHHIRGRGPLLRAQEFWIAVSRKGHDWIHANGRAAREKGWLK